MKITILPPLHSALSDGRGSDGALGGIETACLELGDALVDRGHEVRIAGRFPEHRKARPLDWNLLAASDGDALISCNDARVLRAGDFKARVFWSHNPLAVEKAIRKKQFGPIWAHRPHAVFGSQDAMTALSPLLRFRSRNVIPLGVTSLFERAATNSHRGLDFAVISQAHRGLPDTCRVWREMVNPAAPGASLHVFGSRAEQAHMTLEAPQAARIQFHHRPDKQEMASFMRRPPP